VLRSAKLSACTLRAVGSRDMGYQPPMNGMNVDQDETPQRPEPMQRGLRATC
jgi:hypothetical protein